MFYWESNFEVINLIQKDHLKEKREKLKNFESIFENW